MIIHEKDIGFYIKRLRADKGHFCFPGYSDAEFYCMMKLRLKTQTGLGQIIHARTGDALISVMQRRQNDSKWLFAIPKILWTLPLFERFSIDSFLSDNQINIEGYERDSILDDRARDGELFALIYQLQQMDTVLIGPQELGNGGLGFLDYKNHFPIPSPNFHLQKNGLSNLVADVNRKGYNDVCFLISAGVSAPLIIDWLYSLNPYNYYIDVGSIWDAFVGIGGQREWRAELYKEPKALEAWKRRNILGY